MAEKVCWLCGRNGACDPLDEHHIFGGAYRKKSEKYGLKVHLCHHDCHIFGRDAVHNNGEVMERLKRYGQKRAMEENGWTVEDFRREFGKNYLTDEDLQEFQAVPEAENSFFLLEDVAPAY